MNGEEQKILNIKVKYEDAIYGIVRYKEKIDELKKAQEKLKDEFKYGKLGYDEYATSMATLEEQTKNYKGAVRELSKDVQSNIKIEREQEGSLKALRAELGSATRAYDALSREERNGAKGKELEKHINAITKELREAEQETQRFQRSVGSYEDSIKKALGVNSNFANSILNMTSGGSGLSGMFNSASASAKAFGSTLLGMLTNPVFLSLAGIVGAGVAVKWFFDYNKGIEEATRLTREFLGLTGDNLKAMRSEIQATADTYGKDYKEVLEAVDVLTAQYGIDAGEALNIVNDGLQSGADLNGDMIAQIKQYAPAFRDANIGAKELVGSIHQTRSGIFSKEGMDLIQMGSKKIREMSDKTAQSLDGIGISSKKIQEELRNGTKSTFDVIKLVSTKLKDMPQNSKEVGNVLKDVFGRQGANAGLKMIEQLDTMNVDLDKLKETTGEYGKKMNEQREANEELNKTMAALFDMSDKGFGEMLIQIKTLTIQGFTRFLKTIINTINRFIDLYNQSESFRAKVEALIFVFKALGMLVKLVFNEIIDGVKGAARGMKGFYLILEGIATFSFDKVKQGFEEVGKTIKESWGDLKTFGSDIGKGIDEMNKNIKEKKIEHIKIPAYIENVSTDNKKDDNKKDDNTVKPKGKSDDKTTPEQRAKKEAEEIRKAEDLLAQIVEQTYEQRRKAIQVQYDRQIEDLKRRLKTEKGLTVNARKAMTAQILLLEKAKQKKLSEFDIQARDEEIKRETEYLQMKLETVKKGTAEELTLKISKYAKEEQLQLDALKLQSISEEEKEKARLLIRQKYDKLIEDATKEHNNKLIDEQTKAIEDRYKEKILKEQINGGGDNSELETLRLQMEAKQALLDAAQQKEGEKIEEFNLRKLQLEKDFVDAKQAVSEKEISIEQAKYQAIAGLMGGIQQVAEAVGEDSKGLARASKVLALAEIAINTGVAIAKMTNAESSKGVIGLATMAGGIAGILANIASAIKTVKSAKFAKGGLVTGPGSDTSDSIPAHLSNGESVLTARATRMFAPALSAFNQIGGGVPIMSNIGSNNTQIGEEFLARAVARGMAMMPRPVVSVEEINRTNGRVEVIENLGAI